MGSKQMGQLSVGFLLVKTEENELIHLERGRKFNVSFVLRYISCLVCFP